MGLKGAICCAAGLLAAGQPAMARDYAHDLVESALATLSAGTDLHTLGAIGTKAREVAFDIVENDHPGAPYYATVSDVERTEDLVGDRQFSQIGPASEGSSLLLTRDVSVGVSAGDPPRRTVRRTQPSWETQDPIHALRLAEAAPDLVREPDVTLHSALQHVVAFHNGRYPVRILIDAATGLISATEALVAFDRPISEDIAWTGWGDVRERTEYINWSIADGVRYPFQRDIFRDGALRRTVILSEMKTNPAVQEAVFKTLAEDVPNPASVDDLPLGRAAAGAPAPNKPIEEIAPDVVQIPNSWYVTLVRQPDGVVILDAPISAGYSRQVLAEAERRFPGVPVKAVITSTGFYWHVAGIREYAARGIPIYAEARNAAVIQGLLAAPHTLIPDDLARYHGPAPVVRAVSEPMTIGSGKNALVVMPIAKATQPMLMTYLKDLHILHTGEMVLPLGPGGALLNPESLLEITREVRARGLEVERMIGMHMSPTPWSKVAETLKAAGAEG